MISNIFSSFDLRDLPSATLTFYWLPWAITFLVIPPLISSFYLTPTRTSLPLIFILQFLYAQSRRTAGYHIVNFPTITISIFLIIIITNLISIVPYVLGPTTHIAFTLSLAIPIWLSTFISGITFSPYLWLIFFLPTGAPILLAPFLVVVETIRNFARFLTLALRLSANLTVGHVILGALRVYIIYSLFCPPVNYWAIIALIISIGYILFEFGVATLQAYIFFLLASLYTNDHPIYMNKCFSALRVLASKDRANP